jgi:hypothetical protein
VGAAVPTALGEPITVVQINSRRDGAHNLIDNLSHSEASNSQTPHNGRDAAFWLPGNFSNLPIEP